MLKTYNRSVRKARTIYPTCTKMQSAWYILIPSWNVEIRIEVRTYITHKENIGLFHQMVFVCWFIYLKCKCIYGIEGKYVELYFERICISSNIYTCAWKQESRQLMSLCIQRRRAWHGWCKFWMTEKLLLYNPLLIDDSLCLLWNGFYLSLFMLILPLEQYVALEVIFKWIWYVVPRHLKDGT